MGPRSYTEVYCNSNYEVEVQRELRALMIRLQKSNPEFEFDISVDWTVAEDDD